MNSDVAKIYSDAQQGGELPYFVGKQYGSGWLSALGKYAFPILQEIGNKLKRTAVEAIPKISETAVSAIENYGKRSKK